MSAHSCGLIQQVSFLSGWTSLDKGLWPVSLDPQHPLQPAGPHPNLFLISRHCPFPRSLTRVAVKVTNRPEKAICQPYCLSRWELPRAEEKAAGHHVWLRKDQTPLQDHIALSDRLMQRKPRLGEGDSGAPSRPSPQGRDGGHSWATHRGRLFPPSRQPGTPSRLPSSGTYYRLLYLTRWGNFMFSKWAFMYRKRYSEVTLVC